MMFIALRKYVINGLLPLEVFFLKMYFIEGEFMAVKKVTKSKDRAATEAKLLLAAEEVISQLGFKGATTRLIAKKANINISLINRYFDGKYGLFLSLVTSKMKSRIDQLLTYPPQETVEDELCHYGDFLLTGYFEHLKLFKIVMGQFISDAKFLKKFRNVVPMVIGNPQLETRLQVLMDQGKMSKEYPLAQVIDDIEAHACALCLTKIVIHDKDQQDVANDFKNFILRYSQSLKTCK